MKRLNLKETYGEIRLILLVECLVERQRAAGVYLTWQSWSYSEGEAVESSGGRRVRLHRSVSIHLIDIREPEVLLHQQPKHRGERADGR